MKRFSLPLQIATICIIAFSFFSGRSLAQGLSSYQLDSLVEKTLRTFNVPGIALAIIKDGQVIHSKGYGVRSIVSQKPVDENTLFAIASNSKAFTSAALGMLVDEGKIKWDTKVRDVIPEFKLYSPYVTEEFTVRDLLTHRSGLGLGAGDLMIWPDSTKVTKEELIHNLRYLKPVSSFRTKYDYDNLLYIVAGEVVDRVSGITWEEFIERRIMEPLGMNQSSASLKRIKNKENVIDAHAPVNGKLEVVSSYFADMGNAAGGIYSNIADLSKWVLLQLNDGKYGPQLANTLFSTAVHAEMWTPQTIIRGRATVPYKSNFTSYGLGWNLTDINGYFQAMHTGGLGGVVTQTTILPELNLGILVLTNQQSGAAFTAISNQIKDAYFGIKGTDRINEYATAVQKREANAVAITDQIWKDIDAQQKQVKQPDLTAYTGNYQDPWFGTISLTIKNNKLYFQSEKSPKLRGEAFYYKGNTFVVKWEDRSMDADAFLIFSLSKEGKADAMKMEAISPLTDFSFDFQDLDFHKASDQ